LGLIAIIGVAVGLRVSDRPLLHGFVARFLAGLVAIETQALFRSINRVQLRPSPLGPGSQLDDDLGAIM
jgi:hypothetical protein